MKNKDMLETIEKIGYTLSEYLETLQWASNNVDSEHILPNISIEQQFEYLNESLNKVAELKNWIKERSKSFGVELSDSIKRAEKLSLAQLASENKLNMYKVSMEYPTIEAFSRFLEDNPELYTPLADNPNEDLFEQLENFMRDGNLGFSDAQMEYLYDKYFKPLGFYNNKADRDYLVKTSKFAKENSSKKIILAYEQLEANMNSLLRRIQQEVMGESINGWYSAPDNRFIVEPNKASTASTNKQR